MKPKQFRKQRKTRVAKDWQWIKPLFQAGYSLRQIAAKYEANFKDAVSPETIRQAAKRYKWKRDLSSDVAKATQRKLVEGTLDKKLDKVSSKSDDQIVEEAAEEAAAVVRMHRDDVRKLQERIVILTAELADGHETEVVIQPDGTTKEIRKPLPLRVRSGILKDLAFSTQRLVATERISFNMDIRTGDKVWGSDGIIYIENPTPEPKPLPEGI